MKRKLLIPIAATSAIFLLAIACKKQNPTTPVNNNCVEDTPCSFCFGDMLELGTDNLIISTPYAQQVPFLINGQQVGPSPILNKTPTGFYGYQGGVSIAFNSANMLACVSNKITFVHGRIPNNSNPFPALVNVQFPGTPMISTIPDSLNYFLNPYGYTVEHHFQPGQVWMSQVPGESFTGIVDSIIIRGPEFETVTVGANLFESELRSICVAHE
ncbi:hypothetical protein [Fluviicola taffensis]|uniref:Uncharacterized protein n=1 Tax=Fluviicola taffensis (strain DSM 16823 / NCIMB 13979 / RW262) TaxID=755732 RepID=F2II81_FLUTR|nr:hypothetical protein [Fluviicola taffensis]AEA43790.1 hypothetical protein Fluta_1801 [Fluviicola taffensis DSM 16823]